jgi:Flp pilus assembly protein TadD
VSLLMDALRKAEQEKKEAAKRLREQTSPGEQSEDDSSGELKLVPEEQPGVTDAKADIAGEQSVPHAGDPGTADPGKQPATADTGALSLTLSPLDDDGNAVAVDEATAAGSTGTQTKPPVLTEPGDTTIEGGEPESGTVRIDTLPSDQWVAATPEDPSSRTDENEQPAPRSRSAAGARDLSEDTQRDTLQDARITATQAGTIDRAVGNEFSPVTAQSVFAARRKTSNYTMHTVVALLILSTIAAVSYGIFAYYAVTPITPDLPSPMVARGIEQNDPPPVLPMPGPIIGEVAPVEPAPMADPAFDPASPPGSTSSAAIGDAMPVETITKPEVIEATEAVARDTDEADPPAAPAATAMTSVDADEMLELKPALLKISRSQPVEDKSARAVNDAYAAYERGRYDTAGALYRAVLADNPEHRDALLGMGAIAMRMQQHERAFDYYMRVLRLNPSDRVAQAALISLQSQDDPVASESRIRLLLEQSPNAPYLHFTLGNLYAAQSRWPDAQQAFFDAHRLDSRHPDYALNLAVSLDRLGQPRAARDYYRMALELADHRDANFDTAQIALRLQALSTALDRQ